MLHYYKLSYESEIACYEKGFLFLMERVTGIEPVSLAWKAKVIAIIRHTQNMTGLLIALSKTQS